MNDFLDNPDRSEQYRLKHDTDALTVVNMKTGTEQKLLDQVNENFRQMRLLKAALDDRNSVISELHKSIKERDDLIKSLHTKIRLSNKVTPFLFAFFGGLATELGQWVLTRIVH